MIIGDTMSNVNVSLDQKFLHRIDGEQMEEFRSYVNDMSDYLPQKSGMEILGIMYGISAHVQASKTSKLKKYKRDIFVNAVEKQIGTTIQATVRKQLREELDMDEIAIGTQTEVPIKFHGKSKGYLGKERFRSTGGSEAL